MMHLKHTTADKTLQITHPFSFSLFITHLLSTPLHLTNKENATMSIQCIYSGVLTDRSKGGYRTLPMVTKTERSTRKQMTTCADVYVVPTTTTAGTATFVQTHEQAFQVVVLRVSIHCQGCAAKVKKHISKMEGVSSYSVDLESKRVTVMGHVSAAIVLESISKIKKAELWIS